MLIEFIKKYFLLAIIFIIALCLRTNSLASIPTGIHGDEASIGYNAYSLLKTGKDQNGNFLPLAIDQFGDFRPAGYHYLDIPFVAVMGLNETSTRLPSALFGSATIIVFYFFLNEFFKNKRISIIGTALLAISPWHINISRATSEGVIAAFFIILGLTLWMKALKAIKRQNQLLILSIVFLFISFFFYHSARFFVPLILIPITILPLIQDKFNKKLIVKFTTYYLILISSLLIFFVSSQGANRPLSVSIFNVPGGATELKHSQDQDGTQNPIITRFYHNKLFFYGRLFASSYFQHFDGDFLFVNNGLPIRYRIPSMGNLYPIEIIFIIFGFAVLLVEGIKAKKLKYLIPIIWLLIAAIPSGLTWEDIPNIQRSSLMLYSLIIISAFGINEILNLLKKPLLIRLGAFVIFVFLLQGFLYFKHQYFYHSPIQEPWHRSAAVKEVVFQTELLSKEYENIIMTTDGNNNLIHQLYYKKFDPVKFHKLGSPQEHDGLKFEKILLSGNPCPISGASDENIIPEKSTIYIEKFDCDLPMNAEIINTINHPDGTPAFIILKLNEFKEEKPIL